jgi:N-acetylglucosamine-6-phosphate deacetylase
MAGASLLLDVDWHSMVMFEMLTWATLVKMKSGQTAATIGVAA